FQSSLLTSVAWKGVAPYKAVCTHGWVVDGEGRKMSKSLGNGIAPEDIIKEYGADILRLWVASSDYHADIHMSKDILKQLSEGYRKIRNTARYILGNLYDFDPATDSVTYDELTELDRWALMRMDEVIKRSLDAYDHFEFHVVYHTLRNFCVVDMSNFYLDVIKDRLYVEAAQSKARRCAQTAMYQILCSLTRLLAPILAFTADEIWSYLPQNAVYDKESVLFNDMPKPVKEDYDPAFVEKWEKLSLLHDDVKKELENLRAQKVIGKSLDAKLTLYATGDAFGFVKSVEELLPTIFIVSQVEVVNGEGGEIKGEFEGVSVTASKASGETCVRCLAHSETVGADAQHPDICTRCRTIIDAN
ncbi:MAG: class I tRNA ligase family protein, partial [Acetanaerobacterium sp.]